MLRSFATAEDMVRALEEAVILPVEGLSYNPGELYGCFAYFYEIMKREENPITMSFWMATCFWNYVKKVYESTNRISETEESSGLSICYREMIATYGSSIVQVLVEEEYQDEVAERLNRLADSSF